MVHACVSLYHNAPLLELAQYLKEEEKESNQVGASVSRCQMLVK